MVRIKADPHVREDAHNAVVTILALPGSSERYPQCYEIDFWTAAEPQHKTWFASEQDLVPIDPDKYDGNIMTTWQEVRVWSPKKEKTEPSKSTLTP